MVGGGPGGGGRAWAGIWVGGLPGGGGSVDVARPCRCAGRHAGGTPGKGGSGMLRALVCGIVGNGGKGGIDPKYGWRGFIG